MKIRWLRRKNNLSSFARNYNSSTGLAGNNKRSFRKKVALQVGVCLVMALIALNIIGSKTSFGRRMEGYLKYLMTKEVNYKPVFQKVVDFSLRYKGFDWPSLNDSYKPPAVKVTAKTEPQKMSLPLSGKVIRSFGWTKSDIDEATRFHEGIDIETSLGQEVKATKGGKVVKIGEDKEIGQYIIIDHGQNIKTLYAPLCDIAVQSDEAVKEGTVIGHIAQGVDNQMVHLHFEVREKGKLVDPLAWLKTNP